MFTKQLAEVAFITKNEQSFLNTQLKLGKHFFQAIIYSWFLNQFSELISLRNLAWKLIESTNGFYVMPISILISFRATTAYMFNEFNTGDSTCS